jgi:hypothetical protein
MRRLRTLRRRYGRSNAWGGNPAPKFRVGDRVARKDGSQRGEVSYIGSYDDLIKGYRYKVLEPDGTRLFWNEGSMRRVRRAR